MGFCRRCGDIVSGPRCKCGGLPVAAVLQWNQGDTKKPSTDRWSQTYVSRGNSTKIKPVKDQVKEDIPSSRAGILPQTTGSSQQGRRFPRPLSTSVSDHITNTTSPTKIRPSSPLKSSYSYDAFDEEAAAANAIVQAPPGEGSRLAKVHGSVLQSKESLDSFQCHACFVPFPPDATLYPDPLNALGSRFYCRSCFIQNGGSKGDCQDCHRPVLILKSDGGFVENNSRVWHKRCFSCSGCGKSIGDQPMVDLLGKPTCPACFETCLIRGEDSPKTPRRYSVSSPARSDGGTLGGVRGGDHHQSGRTTREGSPALEELEQRLGIRSRETTPAREAPPAKFVVSPQPRIPFTSPKIAGSPQPTPEPSARATRASDVFTGSPRVADVFSSSPARHSIGGDISPVTKSRDSSPAHRTRTPRTSFSSPSPGPSPKPTQAAIEEMKQRFLRQSPGPSPAPESPSTTFERTTPTARRSDMTSESVSTRRLSRRSFDHPSSPTRAGRSSDAMLWKKASSTSMRSDIESTLSMSAIPTGPPSVPSTPDLMSDSSESMTESSGLASPARFFNPSPDPSTPAAYRDPKATIHALSRESTAPQKTITTPGPAQDSVCGQCALPLFNVDSGGRYITVPDPVSGGPSRMYHADCFRCRICDGVFDEKEGGQAVFVRGLSGACHLDCAPSEKITVRTVSNSTYTPTIKTPLSTPTPSRTTPLTMSSSTANSYSSSRYSAPLRSAPASKTSFHSRFGSASFCPGCQMNVSPMEPGVVPGPQGTRWHKACLICGGREARGRNGRRKDGKPGCGKQLDSSAKSDAEERIWCRECLLLIPAAMRAPQTVKSQSTGNGSVFPKIAPQTTGTTIARQFTGMSSGGSPPTAHRGQHHAWIHPSKAQVSYRDARRGAWHVPGTPNDWRGDMIRAL
ncbi:unnamed protein product [Peniophora sp. CBMAI 1063]|nr:unnamed protein product [Peniophora sp. CBMAI 1063]